MVKQKQKLKDYLYIDDDQHPVIAKALEFGIEIVMAWSLQDEIFQEWEKCMSSKWKACDDCHSKRNREDSD